MSHIKDRLSDYHDWIQDIVNRYELITARDVLEMIEQLQDDLEQDEKENGWIPVSERLPETSGTYQVTCSEGKILHSTYAKFQCKLKRWDLTGVRSYWKVTAWMPLPEPYKEG